MLRVLLADDDNLVKEVLQSSIPWESLGMDVIGLAENGQEALEFCIDQKPDILVTDIKMPFLSGLEVALYLKEREIHTRVVLISGVQDFNYARTALNVQAAGYILKPIQLKEVIATLRKVRDAIEIEQNRNLVLNRLQQKLNENIPLARDKFLYNLIYGMIEPEDGLQEKIDYFSLPFQASDELTVAIAEIDDYPALVRRRTEEAMQLLNFSVKDIVEQMMSNYQAGICVSTRDNESVLVFRGKYCDSEKMNEVFESVTELVEEFDGITLSFGVGFRVSGVSNVSSSFRGARKALDYKFYVGNRSTIHISDFSDARRRDVTNGASENIRLADTRKKLVRDMKHGDLRMLESGMADYYALLTEAAIQSREYVRGQFLELIIHAYREFCEMDDDAPEMYSAYVSAMKDVLRSETIVDAKNHAYRLMHSAALHFSTKYATRNQSLVEKIKDYVNQMHMQNISLADIANHVFMSTNYICAVFKRETGQTVNEYIIEVKMNAAKEMLRNTKLKVLEIAGRLGYETPHYFSYSFKHHTGETPQQYRNKELD